MADWLSMGEALFPPPSAPHSLPTFCYFVVHLLCAYLFVVQWIINLIYGNNYLEYTYVTGNWVLMELERGINNFQILFATKSILKLNASVPGAPHPHPSFNLTHPEDDVLSIKYMLLMTYKIPNLFTNFPNEPTKTHAQQQRFNVCDEDVIREEEDKHRSGYLSTRGNGEWS